MNITFRPIQVWPGELKRQAQRKDSRFKAGYSETLRLLDREILHLCGKNLVIQLALSESDIRLDGLPRVQARPAHPGVILSLDSRYGPLSYPCDTYNRWQDNLRAIALAMEALRKVDRYGVTKTGEQYRGWLALPPATVGDIQTADEARAELGLNGDLSLDTIKSAWKKRAYECHPDHGGSDAAMRRCNEAYRILSTALKEAQ